MKVTRGGSDAFQLGPMFEGEKGKEEKKKKRKKKKKKKKNVLVYFPIAEAFSKATVPGNLGD